MRNTRNTVIGLGLGLALALFVVADAMAQTVKTNYTPGTDFSKYKTYKWVAIEGAARPNQIVDQQIKQAIDSQLSAKGLTRTESDPADLYVGYQVSINQEKQWNAYGTGGYGAWRLGGGMATATSSTINVGTLVLDMYDVAAKQLVWTGSATKTLDPSKDPEKNQEKLNKGMAKLLKNFPPH